MFLFPPCGRTLTLRFGRTPLPPNEPTHVTLGYSIHSFEESILRLVVAIAGNVLEIGHRHFGVVVFADVNVVSVFDNPGQGDNSKQMFAILQCVRSFQEEPDAPFPASQCGPWRLSWSPLFVP